MVENHFLIAAKTLELFFAYLYVLGAFAKISLHWSMIITRELQNYILFK